MGFGLSIDANRDGTVAVRTSPKLSLISFHEQFKHLGSVSSPSPSTARVANDCFWIGIRGLENSGNPGIVSYYGDFIEALYENLGGNASVTVIGHTAHVRKAVANGRLFSLQEQIDHKVDFIEQEMSTSEIPIVLIGHSIGAYIGLEIFKRMHQKVKVYVGLYPFLTLNRNSSTQSTIGMVSRFSILSGAVSLLVSLIGSLPTHISEEIVKRLLGPTWSFTAIDATCTHLLRYHTMRNVLYMAMTEFRELSEEPDWLFLRQKKDQIAFLFGDDDHWGPLTHFEEISMRVPGIDLSVEREGWTHSFSCTMAGSVWVARYVADIIRKKTGTEKITEDINWEKK